MKNGHSKFYELLDLMAKTHSEKNSDYAIKDDPLSNLRASERFGIAGYRGNAVRMADKWERFCNLLTKEPNVKGETIKDTLMDLAVYSLLEIILIEEYEQNNTNAK